MLNAQQAGKTGQGDVAQLEEHRLCKLIELNAVRHGCFPRSERTGIELLSTLLPFLEGVSSKPPEQATLDVLQ